MPCDKSAVQARRVAAVRQKYGQDAFKKWGKKGGNPLLLAVRELNRQRKAKPRLSK